MYKKTLLIDLDGVLNIYNGDYDENVIPPIKDGAREFLSRLHNKFDIKIFTTRDIDSVRNWVTSNQIDKYISGITKQKEPAYLIIDDRCLLFEGDFDSILQKVDNFSVWYKKN